MYVIVGGDHIRLPVEKVLYFRADSKYVFAVTLNASFKFESSLDAIEREFPDQFWRVHRKYLVKGEVIEGLVKIDGTLFLDIVGGVEPVPVSRRETPKVRELFRGKAQPTLQADTHASATLRRERGFS